MAACGRDRTATSDASGDSGEALPTRGPVRSPATAGGVLAVATGPTPATNTERAVAALGGMRRFVGRGDDVVIKPNIRPAAPEYAATTNPEVVATLVRLARGAGASRVRVMDNPISAATQLLLASGIASAVKAAGGCMQVMSAPATGPTTSPAGLLGRHPLYRDMVECDVLINVPIAKQHGSTGLTLAGKNLMGCTSDRGRMHNLGLSRTIAELNAKLKPDLTVLDAIRILVRNGPTGGKPERRPPQGHRDRLQGLGGGRRLRDAACSARTPGFVPYIAAAAKMGLGQGEPLRPRHQEVRGLTRP